MFLINWAQFLLKLHVPHIGSEGNFSWRRITYLQLICAIICVLSSYVQLRTNFILSNLRYNKDGKITFTAYKIPYGGLFEYISGALQFTEIIIYILLSIILWQSTNFHYITLWVIINQVKILYNIFKVCI